MSILEEIFAHRRQEVAHQKMLKPVVEVRREAESAPPAADFLAALRAHTAPALIAEVKHRSPSRGVLAQDFDPLRLARTYVQNGASAVSVLTERKYFGGSLQYLRDIHHHLPGTPLLRKDFLFDPYQLYEARAAGASAVLLIAAMLDDEQLAELHTLALSLDLVPLVEVHTRDELNRALRVGPRLVGINNRDLADFSVRLETSLRLRGEIPAEVLVVAESGIHTVKDVQRLAQAGVDAILVGEALVTSADTAAAVRRLAQVEAEAA